MHPQRTITYRNIRRIARVSQITRKTILVVEFCKNVEIGFGGVCLCVCVGKTRSGAGFGAKMCRVALSQEAMV